MDYNEVKVCLRGLLSSTPLSYRLNNLLRDFKYMTGSDLPLFGYSHPIEFLRTLDDTIQLFGDFNNPEVALVQSQKSAHIISLVERQRTSTHKRFPHVGYKPKRLIMPEKMKGHEKETKYFSDFPSRFKNYKKSSQVPWQSNNFLHWDKPFTQKTGTNSEADFRINNQNRELKIPAHTNVYGTNPNSLKTIANEVSKSTPVHDTSCNEKPQVTKNDSYNSEDASERESGFGVEDKRTSCCIVNEGIKNKFKKIIKSYPNGLWCCELPVLFQEEYKFPLDYREYGYTSLIQMVSELPDVFRCVRPGNEDWMLFDATVSPSPEENKMMALQAAANTNSEVTTNMKKLLCSCFENTSDAGIELNNLLKLYKRMFGTDLDLQSTGFNDFKTYLKTWEGNLLNFMEIDGKTFVVSALKTTPQAPLHWKEAIPPITAENDIFVEIFPKEVVGPKERLVELDLTRHIAVGQVVQVSVADVWSPSKFYLQLNKFKTRLSNFMDNMQKFYNVHLNKYKMPEPTIRPNQICAGLYAADSDVPEEWYRAKIVKNINEKIVLINLADYGTIARVKKSQLRFLHRNFQSFPVQGFLAQLSGVVPVGGEAKWPLSTCKKFLELLQVPAFDAEMVDIDFKNACLSVNLFYPTRASGISVNQILVREKLAIAKEPSVEELFPESTLAEEREKVPDGEASGVSERESPNKNLAQMTDEFSDIDDLGQTPLFPFKTKCVEEEESSVLKTDPEGVENLKYEFDEVLDLEFNSKLKVEENPEPEVKEVVKDDPEKVCENVPKPVPCAPEKPQSPLIAEPPPPLNFSVPLGVSKRSPPGLERISLLPNLRQIQTLLNQNDLRRNVNSLALELLTTNPSIRQVGIINPPLALQIATEMAEVSIATECGSFPYLPCNRPLVNPLRNVFVPPPAALPLINFPTQKVQIESKPMKTPEPPNSSSTTEDVTENEKPHESKTKTEKANEYVKEIQIHDKTIHLITIANQKYFSAEEVVQKFTAFSNREIADRILRTNKIYLQYRVLTKATDEKILKEIKSSGLQVAKKLKKLKVYLIPAEEIVFFLKNLGSLNENIEKDFKKLQTKEK